MAGAASAFGQKPSRRFLIDGHQHYGETPGYIKTLVDFYAPRNAMACVLTFMKDWDVVKRAAREHADVVESVEEHANIVADGRRRTVRCVRCR